ncbi:fungal-specific transcription factor domain-containing protein [Plectosphaerella plurivora]|uniref:Fungal-specific transcription factor domain-containing protein n=1 Tax=Plectosphaerella plurivora TaxID=936078 RepID=A0A9P8VND6_9PEZI|nr:fungal-specific transcription factor domain-containing protein [Plectosphaerella plurivora]
MSRCPCPWNLVAISCIHFKSKEQKFLWDYFTHVASRIFDCYDSIPTDYDPRHSALLPAMGSFDATLLSSILAFSAYCLQMTGYAGEYGARASSLFSEAFNSLTVSLTEDWIATEAMLPPLAAALLLYHCGGPNFSSLLSLARGAAIRISQVDNSFREDLRCQSLFALLAWTDVCTINAIAAPTVAATPAEDSDTETAASILPIVQAITSQENLCPDFGSWVTHPIYAFSQKLIKPMMQIGRLAKLRTSATAAIQITELNEKIEMVELDLLEAYKEDTKSYEDGTSSDPGELMHVNVAMHAAASIMAYSRLRDTPWTSTHIRRQVATIIDEAKQVTAGSAATRALVFPLFIAGCEALDGASRDFIGMRLGDCHRLDPFQPAKITDRMRKVWEIRDNDPGLNWLQWTTELHSHTLEDGQNMIVW